jgi:hypothetical protein
MKSQPGWWILIRRKSVFYTYFYHKNGAKVAKNANEAKKKAKKSSYVWMSCLK